MSGFVQDENIEQLGFDWVKPVKNEGNTSRCYIAQIGGKQYFMKMLRQEYVANPAYRMLFCKEFEKGHIISHPNIVRYEKLHDSADECYILMENIVGETLDSFVDSHPDYFGSRANLDKFFNQLLDALKCLHENHVVYSDLKPQNIMLTQINNDVKIIDLGFCFTDSYPDSAGTSSGFSAPEHVRGGRLDVSTDIYGVGKIIEYIGRNTSRNLPAVYAKIMLKCLKVRQQDRIQSTDEIIRLIGKRRHMIRRSVIMLATLITLFIAYKTMIYNEHFNAWWDGFQIIEPHVDYDTEYRHTFYRVLSEEERTCEAAGHSTLPNVYLHKIVEINEKEYRLTQIADSAFMRKTHIKSIYIPDGVKSIGKDAFRECSHLLSVYLPNSITEIGEYSFYGCNRLEHLILPPQIKSIPTAAFAGCRIKSVIIPEGVTEMMLDAFGNCEQLESVTLPSTLERIERGVFYNCKSLKQIEIPANVSQIGEYLFWDCVTMTDIYNMSPEPQIIPPIHRNPEQVTLHVPRESVGKYRAAKNWNGMKIVPLEGY